MEICPHCGMYMKPFPNGNCEFCGKNIKRLPEQISENAN